MKEIILYYHPDCLLKNNGINHPERKERLEVIEESIKDIKDIHIKYKKPKLANKSDIFLVHPKENQPLLCTHVNKKITPKNKSVIIYKPRSKIKGSIICHLGEAHLGRKAKGQIINFLNLPK